MGAFAPVWAEVGAGAPEWRLGGARKTYIALVRGTLEHACSSKNPYLARVCGLFYCGVEHSHVPLIMLILQEVFALFCI